MRDAVIAVAMSGMLLAAAPATQPAGPTTSETQPAAEKVSQPLPGIAKPLAPTIDPSAQDRLNAAAAAAIPKYPGPPPQPEGVMVVERIGQLSRTADGKQAELKFETDGKTPVKTSVLILPNSALASMEEKIKADGADVRFQVSGVLTYYRGRNFLLIEKVVEAPKQDKQ